MLALSHTVTTAQKLPQTLTSPIPTSLPFPVPQSLTILRRTTVQLYDSSQNHRLAELQGLGDILAVRPTDEKTFQHACNTLDCDLISLDLAVRHHFPFRHRTLHSATQRGVKIELCYAAGVAADAAARRNLIQNATQIVRATRGRGIVVSGEAMGALACRGPWDVINLAAVWGLGQERGTEAVGKEARWVVAAARLKRLSYRGAVDVVFGGEKPGGEGKVKDGKQERSSAGKRKADNVDVAVGEQPLSKRAQKRKAAQEREVATAAAGGVEGKSDA